MTKSIEVIDAAIPAIGETIIADMPEFSVEEARAALIGIYYAMGEHFRGRETPGSWVTIPDRELPDEASIYPDSVSRSGYVWQRSLGRSDEGDLLANRFAYSKNWHHHPEATVELLLPAKGSSDAPKLTVTAQLYKDTNPRTAGRNYHAAPGCDDSRTKAIAEFQPGTDTSWEFSQEIKNQFGYLQKSPLDDPNELELKTLTRTHDAFWRGIKADERTVAAIPFPKRTLNRLRNRTPTEFTIMHMLRPRAFQMHGLEDPRAKPQIKLED